MYSVANAQSSARNQKILMSEISKCKVTCRKSHKSLVCRRQQTIYICMYRYRYLYILVKYYTKDHIISQLNRFLALFICLDSFRLFQIEKKTYFFFRKHSPDEQDAKHIHQLYVQKNRAPIFKVNETSLRDDEMKMGDGGHQRPQRPRLVMWPRPLIFLCVSIHHVFSFVCVLLLFGFGTRFLPIFKKK